LAEHIDERVEQYLKRGNGDPAKALREACFDLINLSFLISTGYARLRQPERQS
jgi:hypothetical protein